MSGAAQRLSHVLAGQTFPAHRWELIAAAEHYGADARSRQELHALETGRYRTLAEVLSAIDGTERRAGLAA